MATFKCKICGEIFESENAQTAVCPLCKATGDNLEEIVTEKAPKPEAPAAPEPEAPEPAPAAPADLSYDPAFVRRDPEARFMAEIHQMAVSGKSLDGAMGTLMPMPGWDDVLLLGAQLDPPPLDDDASVNLRTVIGKNARQPMVLEGPVFISHMSFGALSREIKIALARGSAMAQIGRASCRERV